MRLGVEAAIVDGMLLPGDVEIADGRIAEVALAGSRGSGIAVPGFVDLQVNGFGGVDFAATDTAGYRRAGEALLATGVTAFQPTLITAPEEDLVAALAEVPAESSGPRILGVHLEGPFLSPRRLGAHPAAARRDPDPALLGRLLDAGPVTYVTLAPELPGRSTSSTSCTHAGSSSPAGTRTRPSPQANAAFDRGVGTVTHLFNAMRPLSHRDPGIVGAALVREDVIVQAILDGHHLAEETARVVWRAAAGRVALVTDAVAATGPSGGRAQLGELELLVRDGVVRREDGVLAGSVLTMLQAVRNLHLLDVPLLDAVAAATSVPARVLGREDLGVLRPGGVADVVVLDDRLEVRTVLVAGSERIAA